MMMMIAAPYTTPWMPGRMLPSSAFNDSASGTRMAAPITGPHNRGNATEQGHHHRLC